MDSLKDVVCRETILGVQAASLAMVRVLCICSSRETWELQTPNSQKAALSVMLRRNHFFGGGQSLDRGCPLPDVARLKAATQTMTIVFASCDWIVREPVALPRIQSFSKPARLAHIHGPAELPLRHLFTRILPLALLLTETTGVCVGTHTRIVPCKDSLFLHSLPLSLQASLLKARTPCRQL